VCGQLQRSHVQCLLLLRRCCMLCLEDVADEVCCAAALQLNFKGHKLNIVTLMNE
jgi:hypothetical protein